jgi:hypothetical protein
MANDESGPFAEPAKGRRSNAQADRQVRDHSPVGLNFLPMRSTRIASLLLSVFLQLAPMVRVAVADTTALLSPIMAIIRWAAGAAAVAGSFHAVSGATGVTITQGNPSATVTAPKGTNGVTSGFRVLIQSTQHGTAKSYRATGLPAGMTLTSITGGVIGGIPTTAGTFTARITGYKNNNQSGDSAAFNVSVTIVNGVPVITGEPQPVTVEAGQSASLTVVATGSALTYRWIKNGVEVPLTTPGATSATLTFNPAKTTDSGDYQVRVSNSGGNKLSATAKLTVNAVAVIAPTIGTPPANTTVAVGGSATFTVSATGGGTLAYQWSKGGSPLNGQTGATLTLSPVAVDSGGTYTVRVSNAGGFAEASADLTVAPVISAQTTGPLTAHVGDTVRLSVTAVGPAPLAYAWRKGGNPAVVGTQAELVLAPAAVADSGTYSVVISSPGASAESAPVSVDVRSLALGQAELVNGALLLKWTAIPGRVYRIESNATLGGAWTAAGQSTPAGAAGSFEVGTGETANFFRLVPQ